MHTVVKYGKSLTCEGMKLMKGIILAGGSGTRLYPLTLVTSKQLLPVYDKPMIYYPLATLMQAGIREILIISTEEDIGRYERLLGNGNRLGVRLGYKVQASPDGLAQAFLLGETFIASDACAMILGDNIFYGNGLKKKLESALINAEQHNRATIFGYSVADPKRFGVVEFDKSGKVCSIEEKPSHPKSSYAVTGLYFYPSGVSAKAKDIRPSLRGELEITDLNIMYLAADLLDVQLLEQGYIWLDTGTVESLAEAAYFVRITEDRLWTKISVPEEIAFENGWIDREGLLTVAAEYGKSAYGQYLSQLAMR